jgi:two-component system nitrogen regulation sensor histidine kinase GlnL
LFAQGRNHLIGSALDKALPNNEDFLQRLTQALDAEAGFNDNDLLLEVEGYPVHLHCVITPADGADDARLVLEFRELQQQLKIAREAKMLEQQEANRELIRNLAHEIKNPLGGIRGSAQLLERELSDPELREFTQVIVKETDRLQSLMNRLLTPNRLPRIEPLNIHEVTERVRTLLLAEYPNGLALRRDYDTSLPDIVGDKEQLMQAILNVARNAAQATSGHGEIHLITRIARQVTIARNRYRLALAISIEDDGPGVSPDLAERIFYPLVSGRDGGTGLGLSLAQSFVSQHHGLIEFESVPGRTRFTILLPVIERSQ